MPIPGSINVLISLPINGSDEKRLEAFKLYQEAFRATKIAGDPSPEETELHLMMEISGCQFGIFPGDSPDTPGNVASQIEFDREEDFRRAYDALASEARESSPIDTPFWCKMHAAVQDQFGIACSLCIPG